MMRAATKIDKKVGDNLSRFRLFRGLSQEKLAEEVGLTTQQIQKYEYGKTRISSSRLWQFSQVLRVPVTGFYDGVEGRITAEVLKLSPDQSSFLKRYNSLTDEQKQEAIKYIRFLGECPTSAEGE